MNNQIEEMANDITFMENGYDTHWPGNCEQLAEELYSMGYRKKKEWIPVTERLPEKGQEVLAYRGDFFGDMMNTYTYLGSGNWEDDYGYRGSAEHEGITHWMPLPEPPERSDAE